MTRGGTCDCVILKLVGLSIMEQRRRKLKEWKSEMCDATRQAEIQNARYTRRPSAGMDFEDRDRWTRPKTTGKRTVSIALSESVEDA